MSCVPARARSQDFSSIRREIIIQVIKANPGIRVPQPRSYRFLFFSLLLVVLAASGVYLFNAIRIYQASFLPKGTMVITQSVLEGQYGLRVSLVAVTAAGGMVDVRMKIIDAEKAKTLLQNPKNYPTLFINGNILSVSPDTVAQGINLKSESIFLLFANAHGLVRTGVPVTILFGNTALEPLPSR
jgi:hypothetical protein